MYRHAFRRHARALGRQQKRPRSAMTRTFRRAIIDDGALLKCRDCAA